MSVERRPLIRWYFPTRQASEESVRERAVISPPPFWLHLWWARRPLAASRAFTAALAVDVEGEPSKRLVESFLAALKLLPRPPRPAYNYPPDRAWIARHSRVGEATFIDAFAGGGSIAFEALRLGFKKVVAVEYNPVAYVILRTTLEYPRRYGARLARDLRRWAEWLVKRVREEMARYYPPHEEGRPSNYIWVRVYRCPDGRLMPALANPLLSKDTLHALKLEGFNGDGTPILRVVRVSSPEEAKKYATVKRKTLHCPSGVLDSRALASQYREAMRAWEEKGLYGHHPAVMAAVKLEDGGFAEPTEEMKRAYEDAERDLREKWDELLLDDLIPEEQIPEGDKTREVLLRGIDRFYKLFNARQLLLHATVVRLVREAYRLMVEEGYSEDYARAVATYLALGHGKLLDYNSAITTWDPFGKGSIRDSFSRHAYMFGEDFAEGDVLSSSSVYWVFFSNTGVVRAVERIVELLNGVGGGVDVVLGDAGDPSVYSGVDGLVYAVADPPYYDNVQYGELSDFFYVWLKRSIGDLYAETGAFAGELTPKEGEAVVNRTRGLGAEWFEARLRDAFTALREAGASRLGVMYAHKSSAGFYTLFSALLESGWKPVGVWGVASEQPRSQHVAGKAAAKSMLVIGAVPRLERGGCYWDAALRARVEEAVRKAVRAALELELSYVDASMASIGAAFEVVGDCWPLRSLEGGVVGVEEVVDYAVRIGGRVLAEEALGTGVDSVTVMYVMARLVYGDPGYDDLRRLGYAYGVPHERFIAEYTEKPRLLRGEKVYPVKPLTRLSPPAKPSSLVDALALAVRAFARGGARAAVEALEEAGYRLGSSVCRVVELLYSDSSGDEKRALAALLGACSDRGLLSARRSRSLTDYIPGNG